MEDIKKSAKDDKNNNSREMDKIYLDNILKHSTENIFWMSDKGRILNCNDNQARFFGFTKAVEAIGKDIYDLCKHLGLSKEHADKIHANDLEIISKNQARNFEESLIIDGKKKTYLSFKNPFLDNSGKVIGIFGMSVDITERKESEEALIKAKEEAEAANRAKSDFLAVISHELRIPLTAVLGMARIIQADEDLIHQQHIEPLNDLIKSGEDLLSLVHDLLDLAKLETGRLVLQPATMDLRLLIEQISTVFLYQAKNKGLELIIDYEPAVPQQIIADTKALRRILVNLIGNAIKFTLQGQIIVKIKCITLSKSQVTLALIVEDSGVGIASEKQVMIFEKFIQADGTRTRSYGGTGLGLSVTKRYIEAMGGSISVESELGQGSIFTCLIPFDVPSQEESQSPWEHYRSKVKILIVAEDIHGEILSKYIGSPLTEIAKGNETINMLRAAQLQKAPFEIVIVSNNINSVNSNELATSIKQQGIFQQPLLLLLTESNSLPIKNAAKAVGFFDILMTAHHPFDLLIDLTIAWEKWLEHKRNSKDFSTTLPNKTIAGPKVLLIEYPYLIQKVHIIALEKSGFTVEVANNGEEAIKKLSSEHVAILIDIDLEDIPSFSLIAEMRHHQLDYKYIPIIGLTDQVDEEIIDKCWLAGMDDTISKTQQPKVLTEVLQRWVVL